LLLLFVSLLAAQDQPSAPIQIQKMKVVRQGTDVWVELSLTQPITPSSETASDPDRIVLILPDTISLARQQHVPVNLNGLRSIRIGLNNAEPPVTRVVLDLDSAHPYEIATDGATIIVKVQGSATIASSSTARRSSPPPAASSGTLAGVFHRAPKSPPAVVDNGGAAGIPQPPPSRPPINLQTAQGTATTANSQPSATRPNFGSLQQGVAYPGLGAPGAGSVPNSANNQQNGQQVGAGVPSSQVAMAPLSTPSTGSAPAKTSAVIASRAGSAQPLSASASPQLSSAQPQMPSSANAQPAPSNKPALAVTAASQPSPVQASPPASIHVSIAQQTPPTEEVRSRSQKPEVFASAASQPSGARPPTTAAPAPNSAPAVSQVPSRSQASSAAPQPSPSPTTSVPEVATTTQLAEANKSTPAPVANSAPVVSETLPRLPASSIAFQPLPYWAISVPQVATTSQLAAANKSADGSAVASSSEDVVSNVQTVASVSAPALQSPPPAVPIQSASAVPFTKGTSAVPAASSVQNAAVQTNAEADAPILALRAVDPGVRVSFKVKYVAEGAAYLDGGRNAGLAEGMKLVIRQNSSPAAPSKDAMVATNGAIAELKVISVAETSAVTEIHDPVREVKPGDKAFLSSEDQEALVQKNTLSETRKYPTVVSFTEGDTLDEEARAEIPKPPMPSVNRARGRFGFDYMGTMFHGSPGLSTTNVGGIVRADITRIGGTYWNLSGYWRGRLTSTSGPQTATLQDLINRTYHLSMTYENPQSAWVAGFGRMYLPWASSLDTIDGGYFGRRIRPRTTLGIFAGSTPDPTSWNYNPDRRIGGTFINFEGGSFDGLHYTSTTGMGLSTIKWQIDRPFAFAENSISYKRIWSVYNSLQADNPQANPVTGAPGPGIGRSFTTMRVQPFSRLELDFNHTYFRDVPTFDPALIGIVGALDTYLFQGFSVGARVEVIKQLWVYTTQGQSNRSGDAKKSGNQAYGITLGHIPWVGLHADVHYSRFSSSFGDGTYRGVSLSRSIGDNFRLEVLAGDQNFATALSSNNKTRFIIGNAEAPLGRRFFLQGGYTIDRGATQNYDQWMFTLGYRFDSKYSGKK
jgi:AMIN domain